MFEAVHPTCRLRNTILAALLNLLLISVIATLMFVAPANARQPFATVAVDARTGKVLYSKNIDGRRYPASLTKVMTLYLVFEDLKAGRIKMDTRMRVSKTASRKPPSKLWLKPGKTIRVRDAIHALVTKSANDVATVVAENLSGSESAFAARMTRTARRIGMTRTTFRNASGLPDSDQVTTARDMATLGLRVQRDFPKYYSYFAKRSFKFGKRRYRNHNRLLGRVSGVDGIKTGYTRASGYNLLTSARRGKQRVVAVVLGAKSGGSRNRYMSSLLDRMFRTKRLRKGVHLAKMAGSPPGYKQPAPTKLASTNDAPVPRLKPAVAAQQSAAAATPEASEKISANTAFVTAALNTGSLPNSHPDPSEAELPVKADMLSVTEPSKRTRVSAKVTTAERELEAPDYAEHLTSWNIQIGAFPTETGAESRLKTALEKAAERLQGKQPFTMKYARNGDVFFRARFSGFNRRSAKRACRTLKQKGLGCFALAPKS